MSDMSKYKISVIIPTYNRSKLLPRAVKSVLDQTCRDFELIIIDDCSTDDTEQVVAELMESDERIRYIRNETNLHAQKARNKAINAAKGEYIASLDDDDVWLPQKLELQLELIKKFAVVGCDHAFEEIPADASDIIDRDNVPFKEKSIEEFGFSNRGFSPSKIMTKRQYLIDVGGYDSSIPGPEGLDLFYRLVSRFGKAAWVTRILCIHYTTHGFGRITDKMLDACEREFDKNKEYRSKSAQQFRLAQMDIMRMELETSSFRRLRHVMTFMSRVEMKYLKNYAKLFNAVVLARHTPLKHFLPLYRKIKYR